VPLVIPTNAVVAFEAFAISNQPAFVQPLSVTLNAMLVPE
jgi:hypothetical protein